MDQSGSLPGWKMEIPTAGTSVQVQQGSDESGMGIPARRELGNGQSGMQVPSEARSRTLSRTSLGIHHPTRDDTG